MKIRALLSDNLSIKAIINKFDFGLAIKTSEMLRIFDS
jgi:hypothetical protein